MGACGAVGALFLTQELPESSFGMIGGVGI
jgi:hypothetical protein